MVSKIKVRIKSEDTNINLPSVPISWLPFFLRIVSRVPKNDRDKDRYKHREEMPVKKQSDWNMSSLAHQLKSLIKEAKPLLKEMEPFTLVEVQSDDAYVLIEMR